MKRHSTENAFALAVAAWRHCRTQLAICDAEFWSDGKANAALKAEGEATWRLTATPAQTLDDVRTRGLFVQALFTDALDRGEPADNRQHAALAVLVTELHREFK